jgi:hypothetical protein
MQCVLNTLSASLADILQFHRRIAPGDLPLVALQGVPCVVPQGNTQFSARMLSCSPVPCSDISATITEASLPARTRQNPSSLVSMARLARTHIYVRALLCPLFPHKLTSIDISDNCAARLDIPGYCCRMCQVTYLSIDKLTVFVRR